MPDSDDQIFNIKRQYIQIECSNIYVHIDIWKSGTHSYNVYLNVYMCEREGVK